MDDQVKCKCRQLDLSLLSLAVIQGDFHGVVEDMFTLLI